MAHLISLKPGHCSNPCSPNPLHLPPPLSQPQADNPQGSIPLIPTPPINLAQPNLLNIHAQPITPPQRPDINCPVISERHAVRTLRAHGRAACRAEVVNDLLFVEFLGCQR